MFLAHAPLYLERVLGRSIWDWFTIEHRAKLDNYAYCDDEGVNRVVEKSTLRAKEKQDRTPKSSDEDASDSSSITTADSEDYISGFSKGLGTAASESLAVNKHSNSFGKHQGLSIQFI